MTDPIVRVVTTLKDNKLGSPNKNRLLIDLAIINARRANSFLINPSIIRSNPVGNLGVLKTEEKDI